MQVIKIRIASLRNDEWFRFFTDYRELVIKFGAETLNIVELYHLFVPAYEKADDLLLVLRKSLFTKAMKGADKKRNDLFGGFYKIINGSITQPDAQKKEAAQRLLNVLQQYKKNILKSNYIEESSALYNLIQDLQVKYIADVKLLAVNEWVNAMEAAEQEFQSYRSQRIQENIDKPKAYLRDIRPQIDHLYNRMINAFETKLFVDGLGGDIMVDPDSLDTVVRPDNDPTPPELRGNITYNFVIAWNEIVKGYRNLLAERAGRRAKQKQQETDNPEPEDDL
jgi:hypothetical protein